MKKVISSILTCTMMLGSIGSLSCLAAAKPSISETTMVAEKSLKKATNIKANLQEKDPTDEDYDNGEDGDIDSEEDSYTEDISDEDDSTDEEETTTSSNVNYLKIAGCTAGVAAVAAGIYLGCTNRQEISKYVRNTAAPKAEEAWNAISKYVDETAGPAIKAFVTTTIPAAAETAYNFASKHIGKVFGIGKASLIQTKNIICSEGYYPGVCRMAKDAKITVWNWFPSATNSSTPNN